MNGKKTKVSAEIVRKKSPISDLPAGVGLIKTENGSGDEYWRVRLGKRFTGGSVRKRDFRTLADARAWIFGDQGSEKGSQTEIKKNLGAAAFTFSHKQLAEAQDAMRRLEGLGTLTQAVDYYLKHAKPAGGVKPWKEIAGEFLTTRRAMGCKPKTLVQYESYLRVIGEECESHGNSPARHRGLVGRNGVEPSHPKKLSRYLNHHFWLGNRARILRRKSCCSHRTSSVG
jgi:hypothetical protein